MKRISLCFAIALCGFIFGISADRPWKSYSHRQHVANVQKIEEPEWPLTKLLVSRALQTHTFSSNKLQRNSHDEVVWRWLKESIATFPQNWVKLNISDSESYGVVLYPLEFIEPNQINYYNLELEKKGLPPLKKDKRYLPINVYQGDIICPNWSGLIDVEEAKLVYFAGHSA